MARPPGLVRPPWLRIIANLSGNRRPRVVGFVLLFRFGVVNVSPGAWVVRRPLAFRLVNLRVARDSLGSPVAREVESAHVKVWLVRPCYKS